MIRVYPYRKRGYYRLYVTGHADFNPGEDVVCAGVSALVCALLSFALQSADCKHLRHFAKKGEVFLSCRGGLGAAYDAVLLGLRRIAEQYPMHVCVENSATQHK